MPAALGNRFWAVGRARRTLAAPELACPADGMTLQMVGCIHHGQSLAPHGRLLRVSGSRIVRLLGWRPVLPGQLARAGSYPVPEDAPAPGLGTAVV